MYEFNPATYRPDLCVECGEVTLDDSATPVVVELEGESWTVGGLYRCLPCQAFLEAGAIRSGVDLKAAHAWLTEMILPRMMIRFAELESELQLIKAAGRESTPEAAAVAMEALTFLSVGGEAFENASRLADRLDEHFGVSSMEKVTGRVTDILRDECPVYAEAELDDVITSLDLRREPDGEVTYACPNPTCPEGSRHPIGFAEPVLTDQVVQALVGRLPE